MPEHDGDEERETSPTSRGSVLVVVHSAARAGAELITLDEVRHLALRHRVIAAVPRGPLTADFAAAADVVIVNAGLPVWTRRTLPWLRALLRTGAATARITGIVREHDCRVIVTSSSVLLAPVLAARATGRPVIVNIREWPSTRVRRALLTTHLRLADVVVATSSALEQRLRRPNTRARVRLIPDGVFAAEEPAPPRPMHDPVRLVVLGTIDEHKCPEAVADVLVELDRLGVPARATVVGEGHDRTHGRVVLDRARRLGVDDRVDVRVPTADVPSLFAEHDVLLFPSRGTHDVTPHVVMEALTHHTPVVATRVGSVDELVTDGITARLVAPGDHQAMARAVRDLRDHPQTTSAMVNAGRRDAEVRLDRRLRLRELDRLVVEVTT